MVAFVRYVDVMDTIYCVGGSYVWTSIFISVEEVEDDNEYVSSFARRGSRLSKGNSVQSFKTNKKDGSIIAKNVSCCS